LSEAGEDIICETIIRCFLVLDVPGSSSTNAENTGDATDNNSNGGASVVFLNISLLCFNSFFGIGGSQFISSKSSGISFACCISFISFGGAIFLD
tara:strand:- start:418 stop:702 length:285 start_codon:yes stop_codon:yes gene_type:complete